MEKDGDLTERLQRVERAETRPLHTSDLMHVGIFAESIVAGSLPSSTHLVGRGSIRSPLPRLWPRPRLFNEGTGGHHRRAYLVVLGGIVWYLAVGVDMDLICQCLGELGGEASTSVLKSSSAHVLLFSVGIRSSSLATSRSVKARHGKMRLLYAALWPRFARRVLSCRLWTRLAGHVLPLSASIRSCDVARRVSSYFTRTGLFASSPYNATICSIVSPSRLFSCPGLAGLSSSGLEDT
jgi:hypothetical protein